MNRSLANRVDYLLSIQGKDPREAQLLEAEIVAYGPHETKASGTTHLAQFDHGLAFHKTHDGLSSSNVFDFGHDLNGPPLHECAAWHFAKALGERYERLLPATVYREIEHEWGSLAAEQPGRKPGGEAFVGAPEDVNDAGFFDVLIGQQDRHLNNFLWDADEARLRLIDHGFCFPRSDSGKDRVRSWMLTKQRRTKAMKLTGEERELIERVLNSDDLLGIAPLLDDERVRGMEVRLNNLLQSGVIPKIR